MQGGPSKKYKSIMKASSIELKNKKQITSATIPLLVLKEFESLLPCKVYDLIKKRIKDIPKEILTNDDKKSRRSQIRANLKKIESVKPCKYDISDLLINQTISIES